jgi:hypothetical protein
MAILKNPLTNKEPLAAMEQPKQPDFKQKIKCQVMARIGKWPRLNRVEVSKHHNGHWRANIWEQPEPDTKLTVTIGPRIGPSFYLTVSDTGEITQSNPPMNS